MSKDALELGVATVFGFTKMRFLFVIKKYRNEGFTICIFVFCLFRLWAGVLTVWAGVLTDSPWRLTPKDMKMVRWCPKGQP
jgi:hypothetical protein